MRFFLLFAYVTAFVWLFNAEAQQNINSLTTKDIKVNGNLEVNSTSLASKPCPVMSEAQRDAITSPQSGRCIYNSNSNQLNIYNGAIWKSAGGGISNWETAFNYAINDVVIESNKIYQCNTAHTSTVFASDIANWTLISDNLPIDLTTDVTDVLPMANGGTDKALTPVLGGLVYTDDLSMEVLGAGTSGQVLKSNGAAAPTWQDSSNKVQGQEQSEVDFTKLQFKNKSITETSAGVQLVESERNLLANGSFEHTTYDTGWTVTGSATISRETSIVRDGKASFKAVTAGNSFRIEQNTTQLQGTNVPAYAIVWVHNTAPGVQVCSILAGSDKDCVTALTDGTWQPYIVPMILGATSNGISVHSGTTAGTTYVDWVRLVDEDLIGTSPVVGPRVAYTPITQGLGVITPASNACTYTQIGPSILLECKITAGTVSSVEMRVSLPAGMTISTGGTGYRTFGGALRDTSASPAFKSYTVIGQASNSYLNFSLDSETQAVNPIVPQLATQVIASGNTFTFQAIVPIAQLASSVPVYYDRCQDPRNCETELSFSRDTSNVITSPIPFTAAWAPTCTGTSTITCNISSGNFTVTPKCWFRRENGPANTFDGASMSTSSATFAMVDNSGVAINVNGRISCQRQGQDYINAKVNQIVGSFKDYVRTPNTATGKVGFCSAKISATGVISDQLGGCFASCTNATTPVCTFTSNYWRSGSVPNCWASCDDWATGKTIENSTTTSTTCDNASFTPQAVGREYFCHGEIQ